ncbi:Rieske 2Fe-2S domain-containing protein [Panacagrimonas sp.]|uniref:Rieske 2Fe-2S domain-containing protein n=1 Tax=Panacagrimonas sp. TaxID=2480088 RepID=UPI003B524425
MKALHNIWYVAAMSTEVDASALFHRKILDTSVLIYRKQDGTPVAMHDRCPHRFAPLHLGKRVGDEVSCLYHALRFDCSGRCTHNPHGAGATPPNARVRVFPLLERHGFIWIWMGEAPADPTKLPDFGPLDDGHPNAFAATYMHMKANYELIVDNVMDLSHIDHVHGEIITTRGQLSPLTPRLTETPTTITSRSEWTQQPPLMIFSPFMADPQASARHYFEITWTAPANIQLSVGAVQDDSKNLDLVDCIGQYDLHTCTPETADTTHYFFATRRNHLVDDGEFNKAKIQAMHTAFETEDGPVIEAVHAEMGTDDFFGLHPVLICNDAGPIKVRRLLRKMIDAEAQTPAANLRVRAVGSH